MCICICICICACVCVCVCVSENISTFFWHCSTLNLEPNFLRNNERHSSEFVSFLKRSFVFGSVNSEARAISSIRPQAISSCPTVLSLIESMVKFCIVDPSAKDGRSGYSRIEKY